MLTRQAWYVRFDPHPTGTNCFDRHQSNSVICSQSYENSTVFLMSLGQFLIAAFVFNKGPPFRRPIYTNIWLLLGEPSPLVLVLGGQRQQQRQRSCSPPACPRPPADTRPLPCPPPAPRAASPPQR